MPAHYEGQIGHWTDCYRISPSVPRVPDNHGFYEIRDVPLWYQYDSSHYREDDEDSALIDVCMCYILYGNTRPLSQYVKFYMTAQIIMVYVYFRPRHCCLLAACRHMYNQVSIQ